MKKVLILLAVVLCFTLVGCEKANNNKEIVGQWKNNEIEGVEFVYTFNEDGTGKYEYGENVDNFKYTIDGNKISFKYTDEEMETFDTTFSIDGDTLNIKDSNNEDTLYEKVK